MTGPLPAAEKFRIKRQLTEGRRKSVHNLCLGLIVKMWLSLLSCRTSRRLKSFLPFSVALFNFTSSFKSEIFMHYSCSLLISGIHFYSHSLRKEGARMSQVLLAVSVDRLTFHTPIPQLSCRKCPKTLFASKEDFPMKTV